MNFAKHLSKNHKILEPVKKTYENLQFMGLFSGSRPLKFTYPGKLSLNEVVKPTLLLAKIYTFRDCGGS